MSKLSLVDIADEQLSPNLTSSLIDAFRTNTSQFPASLLVTQEQAKKFFYAAGQVMTNFKGVPIEVEQKTNERATVVKTINSILTGMHVSNVTDVSHVYQLLEKMKDKFDG